MGSPQRPHSANPDRKSTRLNSSHLVISYAVFCLKKNKIREGQYKNGLRHGTWTSYFRAADALRREGQYAEAERMADKVQYDAITLFFLSKTANPESNTFSLRDALPI